MHSKIFLYFINATA